jgi:lipopolysaccharide transport system permease protein
MPVAVSAARELWSYRELFYFLVWRDIKVRYKQSLLGGLWAIIQPFGTMLVFTLFFHGLASIPSGDVPYPIFSYTALLPWTYFSTSIQQIGNSLVTNQHLITKVYFPRVALPTASAFRGLVDFGIAAVLLLGMMVYYHFPPTWTLLLWIPLLIPLVVLTLAIGMFFAALNVRYRDVQHVLPFLVQLWLFVTPIIYPADLVPPRWRPLMAINPLTGLVEAFRACVLPHHHVSWQMLSISFFTTVVLFLGSIWYFRRTAREFADIV